MTNQKNKKTGGQKIYLDTNILIAYFSVDEKELEKKKVVKSCFEHIETLENVLLSQDTRKLSPSGLR